MSSTRRHIEDLDTTTWARMTRQAALESLETAERLGLQPRPETAAVAAMTEHELISHREDHGVARKQRSPAMQLVEADQRSRVAEAQAAEAHQRRLDADAATVMARAEADESARAGAAAREKVRALEAEAAEKDRHRSREKAADQQALQRANAETDRVRAELTAETERVRAQLTADVQRVRAQLTADIERIRADAAAEVAAAREQARAANARAEQRAGERTTERTSGETALQRLRAELDQVRADSAAEVAAAQEQMRAAEARSEQRAAERVAERAVGEAVAAQLRGEAEQARTDAAAEVEAARGQAAGEVAAVRQAARAEINAALARADEATQRAQDEMAQAKVIAAGSGLHTIPIAPVEVRPQIGHIEQVLDALYQIDLALEVRMSGAQSQAAPDGQFMRNLTWTVQERARGLSDEINALSTKFANTAYAAGFGAYANDAGVAYRVLVERVEGALHRVAGFGGGPGDEVVDAVTAMLADPWVQSLR